LDLYVAAYVGFRKGHEDLCQLGAIRSACGPEHYGPERGRLYLNVGEGRFQDATESAGLGRAAGKTWGVTATDLTGDGLLDLYLANDMMPCDLFENATAARGRPRFTNIGLPSGTAYDLTGNLQGAMGVDSADVSGDGRSDLLVSTYFQQADSLYLNQGSNRFNESSQEAGLALPTLPYVKFGCG
jgi:hypothetical protein